MLMALQQIEKTFGDKTFLLRKKVPLQLQDWFSGQSKKMRKFIEFADLEGEALQAKMASLSDEEMDEMLQSQRDLQYYIAKKMCLKPVVTDTYIKDEADEDDAECFGFLFHQVQDSLERRFEALKKSPSAGRA